MTIKTIDIAGFEVGSERCFIIAEIGNNHNGSVERAKHMVDLVAAAGADCAKFQMRHIKDVYRERTLRKSGEDLGTEYVIDLLERFELSVEEHLEIADYCHSKSILYMCTPWDSTSVDTLEGFGVKAYKVASADLTNMPLLARLAQTGKPLILSTGMSRVEEVQQTIAFLNQHSAQFVLLHCNSTYPAPFHDINLRWMSSLRKLHPLVGYSGHERGTSVSQAAVALGACVIERHFTLDRQMEGPDHAASLEPGELRSLISGIREIESALGTGESRTLSQGEMMNRENLAKSIVAATPLKAGTKLSAADLKVRSPGQGLSPQFLDQLVGTVLKRDMEEEDFFFRSDLAGQSSSQPRQYNFRHPWGVPVRYHDFGWYEKAIKPDLFEFHFSYSDMDLKPDDFLSGTYDMDFVVHAPELFANSSLMDLATPDEAYRKQSLFETQRLVDITRDLKRFFPKTKRPQIVANIGGFTMDAPLPKDGMGAYYDRFAQSLGQLDLDGVELIPQTMAPFPWHFGGQRYQNMFVTAEDIVLWCEKLNLRMCFDISHSFLTCNHLGVDFYDFARRVGAHTAHLHLGDARGLNGEGLQVGDGDIDFVRLGAILNETCPDATFIPEIWQGHKSFGEGFWVALDRLDGLL
ncbi:N-acetylneuraminate synthase family protein [Devosia sp.]|uniref:N-acetylneuraminate synthase family protein n=1 Tax=Devosia sp. TaxID=1871048 RepID=UPI003263CA25